MPAQQLIIADSSPLIALGIVECFDVFPKVADRVWIPETVKSECLVKSDAPGAAAISKAIARKLIQVQPDAPETDPTITLLGQCLDKGEAQAICLAKQHSGLLLIDEKAGRKVAQQMGISITGSLAMLLKAKQKGLLTDIKPAINTLRSYGYRYSNALVDRVVAISGE